MGKRRKSKEELAEELQTKFEKKSADAEADADADGSEESDGGDDMGLDLDERATPDRPERSERTGGANSRGNRESETDTGTGDGPGSGVGDFTALSHSQVEEVNELFRLINRTGYLTIGDYSVRSDGEGNVTVTLTALTPSSGGVPQEIADDATSSGGR